MIGLKRLNRTALACIAAVGMFVGTAVSASTVTFDFSGSGGNTGSTTANYMQGGINLDVVSTGGNITIGGNGLGVSGTPNRGRLGVGELLSFTFSPAVKLLTSIVFEAGNGTDTVRIRDGSGTVLTSFVVNNAPGLFTQDLSALNLTASTYLFDVTSSSGSRQGVRIAGLEVAAVPLPASGLLLIAGLGGLAAMRRRRSAA